MRKVIEDLPVFTQIILFIVGALFIFLAIPFGVTYLNNQKYLNNEVEYIPQVKNLTINESRETTTLINKEIKVSLFEKMRSEFSIILIVELFIFFVLMVASYATALVTGKDKPLTFMARLMGMFSGILGYGSTPIEDK